MEYFTTEFDGMVLVVRDLEERDFQAIADYWHGADFDYLRSIGVEPAKLRSRAETEARLRRFVPGTGQGGYVVTSGEAVVAYTNVAIGDEGAGLAHVHILQKDLRGKGLAAFLFPQMIKIFFSSLPIEKLVFQASPENESVNQFLQKCGLVPRRVRIADPDGMARAGEFNVYELPRAAVAAQATVSGASTA